MTDQVQGARVQQAPDHPVSTTVREGIGVVTIHRPDRLNALSIEVMVGLRTAVEELGRRRDVRAVIMCGEGRAFCAGLDLEAGMGDPTSDDPVEALRLGMRDGTGLIWAMRSIPQPVIAVVQGHAVGAGFAIAAAADLRVIGPEARFSAPFLRLGMTVGDLGLSWFLPRIIGSARANEVFYSAGEVDAEQAVSWGLATSLAADPMAEAWSRATAIAAFPEYGVQVSKELVNTSASAGLREHLDAESRAQVIGGLTEAAQRAMQATLERIGTKPSHDV